MALLTANIKEIYLNQEFIFSILSTVQNIQVSKEESSVFWEVTISVIVSIKLFLYMCSIANGFPDRAVSLYSSLYLASKIVLPCRRTAPLSDARESL